MSRFRSVFSALILLWLSCPCDGLAQKINKEKIKFLTPTNRGSTGLFHVFLADTLRQGEFSLGIDAERFNRDPGDLNFTVFPLSLTFGFHDRIEGFVSFEAFKNVEANSIQVFKVLPGAELQPARLADGQIGFFNDSPFIDVSDGNGHGDLWAGVKFNLLSERRGEPFGLALQPVFRFSIDDDRNRLLKGLTSGATDGGFDVIATKDIGRATIAGNVGVLFAEDLRLVDRQSSVPWGIGLDFPLKERTLHFIGELTGNAFFGSRDTSKFTNDQSPVDAYFGVRGFIGKWVSISGAYNVHFNRLDEDSFNGLVDSADRHGFFAQLVIQRKVNRPPTVECSADQEQVIEGDRVAIRAVASDSDDDSLAITWRTSGGSLSQSNAGASLNTSGLDPGKYTVSAEVFDGENRAECSVDVTVSKRKLPPVVRCEPSSVSVTRGESVTLTAQASDPNQDPLTFSWKVNGQEVPNDQAEFIFGTAGRAPGNYQVQVTVADVDAMSADCSFAVTVSPRPNRDPAVTLAVNPVEVFAGQVVEATAAGSDPDNDPLTYTWQVDGQSYPGSASRNSIRTDGMAGGSHSVTVRVSDGRGGEASDAKSFRVIEKIVIPIDKIRPDNRAKAQLDEIALKLQQNPLLQARITGHTDDRGSEQTNQRVGLRRSQAVRDYLVQEHNIDPNRIEVLSAGESRPVADNQSEEGRSRNRRVEIELFVP